MEAVPRIERAGVSGLDRHVENFLECMKNRDTPNASIEIGGHIARVAQLGNIAYRTGRKIFWDGEEGKVVGDREAQELARASYRSPWELPVI